jgi:hypothetical protein
MAVNLKSAELKIYVYTGAQNNRGAPKYTLKKTKLSGEDIVVFEIAELVKDYINIEFDGDPLTAKTTAWVDTELTRTFEDSATGSISTDNQPLKQTYLAFRGFGEIFDDGGLSLTDKMSNVNPPLSYDLLQSNIEVFHNADDELYIPFLSTSGSGVFSVSYYDQDTVVNTFKYGGDVSRILSSTTEISTSSTETYKTDTTAIRSNTNEGAVNNSYSTGNITKVQYLTRSGETKTVVVNRIKECKYPVSKVSFLNKFGAIQCLYFFKRQDRSLDVEREEYNASTLDILSDGVDFSRTKPVNRTLSVKGKNKVTMNTGFVSDFINQPIKEMLLSEFCWIHDRGGVFPVKPSNLSFTEKSSLNNNLVNFTLDFEFTHNFLQDIR